MRPDPTCRDRRTADVRTHLERGVAGSSASLRGSLASGTADRWSDVDLRWSVPDAGFATACDRAIDLLGCVGPIDAVRSDPDLQRSDRRRLLFVRFADLPAFWRFDLDIRAGSVAHDDAYDIGNPNARGDVWCIYESALANVVAAIKQRHRGLDGEALALVSRGFARVGGQPQVPISLDASIAGLIDLVRASCPRLGGFADHIAALASEPPSRH